MYRGDPSHAPLTAAFEHLDATRLRNIAQYGYFSPNSLPDNIVMFPGFPLTLAAAHLVVRNWKLSELVVPAIAGCFAMVSLSLHERYALETVTVPSGATHLFFTR